MRGLDQCPWRTNRTPTGELSARDRRRACNAQRFADTCANGTKSGYIKSAKANAAKITNPGRSRPSIPAKERSVQRFTPLPGGVHRQPCRFFAASALAVCLVMAEVTKSWIACERDRTGRRFTRQSSSIARNSSVVRIWKCRFFFVAICSSKRGIVNGSLTFA